MCVDEDVEIIAPFDPHLLDLPGCPVQVPWHGNGERVADPGHRRPGLDGIASHAPGALHARLSAAAGVDADLVPRGASEELVDRQARDLSEDIPQGDIDGAEGGAEKHAHVPAVPAVEPLPKILDVRGILADEVALQVFDALGDRAHLVVADRALAQSRDPLVGADLHETAVAFHQVGVHGGDPDTGIFRAAFIGHRQCLLSKRS